jgi:hypothetical protein
MAQQSSDTQSARTLLVELEKREIIPSGMDAEGMTSTLGDLEAMQEEGWQFIPPREGVA